MDETRRFLRYVIPGLLFGVHLCVLMLILLPGWTVQALADFARRDEVIGVALTGLILSGGLGYLMSTFHHAVYWCQSDLVGGPDYAGYVRRLGDSTGPLLIQDAQTGKELAPGAPVSKFEAWAFVTSVWHEHARKSKLLAGADARAMSLSDLIHATGTARASSVLSLIVTYWLAASVSTRSYELQAECRFVFATGLGLLFIWVHHVGYQRTKRSTQLIVEQVLRDALVALAIQRGQRIVTWLPRSTALHAGTANR